MGKIQNFAKLIVSFLIFISLVSCEETETGDVKVSSVRNLTIEKSFKDPIYVDFSHAVVAGDLIEMDKLSKTNNIDVNKKGTLGVTPLFWGLNNLESLNYLLKNGANPSIKFNDGSSLLQMAIEFKSIDIVRALLEAGADTEIKAGLFNETAIFSAIGNDLEVAKLLVKYGANKNQVSDTNNTPMMIAAGRGKFDFVHFMLEENADCHHKNNNGETLYSISKHKKSLMDLNHPLGRSLIDVLNILEQKKCTQ